jgi:hypothetical protein
MARLKATLTWMSGFPKMEVMREIESFVRFKFLGFA